MLKQDENERTMKSIASHLQALDGDLRMLRGKKGYTAQMVYLANVVSGTLQTFENGLPVIKDNPPAPTQEEKRVKELEFKVKQARKRVEVVSAKIAQGMNDDESRNRLEQFQNELNRLERQLA